MKMSELILEVGDENVVMQNLLNDAQTIDKTKHRTKITFYTDQIHAEELLNGGETEKMGLVLWLPRDRVNAAVAKEKARKLSSEDGNPRDPPRQAARAGRQDGGRAAICRDAGRVRAVAAGGDRGRHGR